MYHTTPGDGTSPLYCGTIGCRFSYNFVSSAKFLHVDFVNSGRSFMKIVNNIGPEMLPCGIPLKTAVGFDRDAPSLTL